MMTYKADVIDLHEDVEEEVGLRINGLKLTCFISACAFPITLGKRYQVSLTPIVWGDYLLTALPEGTSCSITKVGVGYAYEINGKLNRDRLEIGNLAFRDDAFLKGFGSLDGQIVRWKIDRIEVEFISELD
ncbi:MAG: hypothetical protein IPJ30_14885 [Acidobacteria bacterium]|nr:hypothetical protein [Acidobacteriota bacterium]